MNDDERKALRDTVVRVYEERGDPRRPELSAGQVWDRFRDLGLLSILIPEDGGGSQGALVDAGLVCEVRGYCGDLGGYPETVGVTFGLGWELGSRPDDAEPDEKVTALLAGVAGSGWQLVPLTISEDAADRDAPRSGVYLPVDTAPTVAVWQGVEPDGRPVARCEDVTRLGSARAARTTSHQDERELSVGSAERLGRELPMGPRAWSLALAAVEALRYAEIMGACRWLQEDARRYATERVQFDRPIGQFQAVQHQLVDMLAWVDAGELLVRNALRHVQEGAGSTELARAGAFVRDRVWRCLFGSYTVLGGMGFIEEMPVNTYCRRLLGVLSRLGPISATEQRSAEDVVPGGWLPQSA